MEKLSPVQLAVLQSAAKRDSGCICPTSGLRGAAQGAVIAVLFQRGLVTDLARPVITDGGRFAVKLAEAEWLVRELNGHCGAEGWSEYLIKRLDAYEFTTEPTEG